MAFQGDSIFWVEVDKVVPNPFQPRREFDEAKIKELAESIRMYGVLQPLTVTRRERPREDGTFFSEYELIAGERRLRASKVAGLLQVPVIIRQGEQTEQEKLELAIIENLQREDLNAVDRAMAFQQLAEVFHLNHKQIAAKMGRSREYVSNTIRLLALPSYMLDGLRRGEISEGHARTLLMLSDRPEEQDVLYREVLLKKISVRECERIARKIATDKVRKHHWQSSDPQLIEYEKALTETLGTRVQIKKTDFGGTVSIDYFDPTDLDKILEIIDKKPGTASEVSSAVVGAVTDALIDEKSEANEILDKLEDNTPLEVSTTDSDTVAFSSDTEKPSEVSVLTPAIDNLVVPPAIDNLVTPPELDTLVTPPSITEASTEEQIVSDHRVPEDVALDSSKEILEQITKEKNEKEDENLYSIKNFGI